MESATENNAWVNTIDSKHPKTIAKAHRIIQDTLYCTLSTCSPEGEPWVSPVFFAYDEQWSLYWCSTLVAKHSRNIQTNQGRVAIAIFNSSSTEGTAEGLYLYGQASPISPELVTRAMWLLAQRAGKELDRTEQDYLDNSPRRIYQFEPHEAWVTGERLAIGNQLVDTKIRVHLNDI